MEDRTQHYQRNRHQIGLSNRESGKIDKRGDRGITELLSVVTERRGSFSCPLHGRTYPDDDIASATSYAAVGIKPCRPMLPKRTD
jgi:hypothetical protein